MQARPARCLSSPIGSSVSIAPCDLHCIRAYCVFIGVVVCRGCTCSRALVASTMESLVRRYSCPSFFTARAFINGPRPTYAQQ